VNSAVKSVRLYTDNAAGDKEKPLSRSSRAQLVFPVSKVDRILKKNALHKNGRLGDTAPVYLASVLEYLAAELLELSGGAATNRKTTQISPRDIMFAIRNDDELNSLFKRHHILGAGVVPTHNISGGAGGKPRRRIIRDSIYGITKPAIRRILSRAGVKSMSGLIYHEIRGVIQITLEHIISSAIHITNQRRAKTINYSDYKEGADIIGIKTISAENHPKLCRKRRRKQAGGWDDQDEDDDDDDDQYQDGGWDDQDEDDDDDDDQYQDGGWGRSRR